MSTVLLPVSFNVLVEFELPPQPVMLPNTSTSNAKSGTMVNVAFLALRRILLISRREKLSNKSPVPLIGESEEVEGAVPVIVKLVVTVAPFVSVSLAGLNVHVIPTGSPVHE